MELTKSDWEQIQRQAESMTKDATISLLASELMLNRAKQELGQIEGEEEELMKKGIDELEKDGTLP